MLGQGDLHYACRCSCLGGGFCCSCLGGGLLAGCTNPAALQVLQLRPSSTSCRPPPLFAVERLDPGTGLVKWRLEYRHMASPAGGPAVVLLRVRAM